MTNELVLKTVKENGSWTHCLHWFLNVNESRLYTNECFHIEYVGENCYRMTFKRQNIVRSTPKDIIYDKNKTMWCKTRFSISDIIWDDNFIVKNITDDEIVSTEHGFVFLYSPDKYEIIYKI